MNIEDIPREAFLYYALMAIVEDMGGIVLLPIEQMISMIEQKKVTLFLSITDDKYYLEVKNTDESEIQEVR